MTDDLDHYTNTYQVYSKDPKKCQEFLGSPEVINWKQHLQIQSKWPGCGRAARLSCVGSAGSLFLWSGTSVSPIAGFLGAQKVKNLPAMQETWVWALDREDPLEQEMTTHSCSSWTVPGTEESSGLQSMGSQESDTTEWLTLTHTLSLSHTHTCLLDLYCNPRHSAGRAISTSIAASSQSS